MRLRQPLFRAWISWPVPAAYCLTYWITPPLMGSAKVFLRLSYRANAETDDHSTQPKDSECNFPRFDSGDDCHTGYQQKNPVHSLLDRIWGRFRAGEFASRVCLAPVFTMLWKISRRRCDQTDRTRFLSFASVSSVQSLGVSNLREPEKPRKKSPIAPNQKGGPSWQILGT